MARILRVQLPSFRDVDWRGWGVRMALPLVVVVVLGYTVDQLLTGERGLVTWRVMKDQVAQLEATNTKLAADVAALDTTIKRIKPDAKGRMDEDFLDELIRRTLPVVKPTEEVVR